MNIEENKRQVSKLCELFKSVYYSIYINMRIYKFILNSKLKYWENVYNINADRKVNKLSLKLLFTYTSPYKIDQIQLFGLIAFVPCPPLLLAIVFIHVLRTNVACHFATPFDFTVAATRSNNRLFSNPMTARAAQCFAGLSFGELRTILFVARALAANGTFPSGNSVLFAVIGGI